jgi:cellulose synthase/poly-beta-1,6-N-acetylglucosamine synthase-like glycosyltransferase
MNVPGIAVLAIYFATLGLLAIYGAHRLHLLRLHARHRGPTPRPPRDLDPLPPVTVQLPIYNELYVVKRLIRAACALDYPRDRLEIQVLDDSDDETTEVAARAVAAMRRRGHDITHVRRGTRHGFKAGALAHGLAQARGDLLAVFDADFVPPPRFLRDLVGHFGHPQVGMVQARWGHLNRDYSTLTRIQAMFLDGHFLIEHAARHRAGRFFNFNGTAGVWRRACIESAGGWSAETLTEDLDLSYRAQLAGWRFVFVPEVVVPAEIPAQVAAFRTQQARWARGSIETARRVLPRLLRAPLPAAVRIEAVVHLTNNLSYLLMLLVALLIVPAMLVRHRAGLDPLILIDLPLLVLSTLSVSAFYLRSQEEARRRRALLLLPSLMALGIGLCLGNARAVLAALVGRRGEFVRTPKHDLRGRAGTWRGKRYGGTPHFAATAADLLAAAYFTAACGFVMSSGLYAYLPFLALFQSGFLYLAFLSMSQMMQPRADDGRPI